MLTTRPPKPLLHTYPRIKFKLLLYVTKAYRGSRGVDPLVLKFSNRSSGQLHVPEALPLEKYSSVNSIGGCVGPQSRSGGFGEK